MDAIKKGQRIFDQNKKKQKSQQTTLAVLKAKTRNTKVQKPRQKNAAAAPNANIHVGKWEQVWDLGEAMRIAKKEREAEFMRRAEEVLADQPQDQLHNIEEQEIIGALPETTAPEPEATTHDVEVEESKEEIKEEKAIATQ